MDRTFAQGYDVLTSYRNSKNFASSWVSAGYSIWFLREARFLNYPRMKLHTNCAISGTGFLVSSKSSKKTAAGRIICSPKTSSSPPSARRRAGASAIATTRFSTTSSPSPSPSRGGSACAGPKGFIRSNAHCGMPLLRGCLRGPIRFSCYDMLMTVAPCTLLTIAAVFINLFCCDDALPAVVPRPFHAPLRRPFPAGYADVELWRDVRLRPAHRSRRVAAHPRLPLKR